MPVPYSVSNVLESAFESPARKLTKSRGKNIHRYISVKMNQVVSVESTLEFDACFHLDFNKEISRFCSQPLRYTYELNGKNRTYVPDFLVQFDCGEFVLYEVKAQRQLNSEIFLREFESKKTAALELYGLDLELIDEHSIRKDPLLRNLKLLHRYASRRNLTNEQISILSHIDCTGSLTLSDLMSELKITRKCLLPMICDLMSKCLLITDLNIPLSENSRLDLSYA